jgi:FimV-like protein
MSKEGYVGVAALIGAVLAAVVAGLAMRRRKQASAPAGDERAATEATSTSAAPAPDAQQAAASAYGAMARDDDTDARGERDGRDGRAAADGLTQPTSTAPTLPATTHDAAAGEGAQRAAAARFGQPEALGQDHSSEGATAHPDEPGTPVPAAEAANAPLSLADSGPELHEPPEAAHPVAAPAHEPPTLTLELPPVASAPAPQHPFATGEPPAAIDEGEGTTEGATGFAADAESKEGLASLPDTAADASLPPDHTDATSAASVASQPFVPTEPLAGAAAAATPSDEHARAAEAPAGLDAANQPQLHPHPQPTESDPSPATAPPFPRAALDALSSLDMALPPRAEAPAVTPPASLSTQPVVEPEVTAREAVPLHEPSAPRVADEIEAGTAGAGAIAGMGAAHYGPLTLDFDLELPSGTAVEPLPTFTPEELARIARNKLDLASEYIGLGDVAGARTLINEVIESNDAATRNDARALLSTLAPLS